jgi:hypothetical protein
MYYSVLLVTSKKTFLMPEIELRLNENRDKLVCPEDEECSTRYPIVKWTVDERSGLAKIKIIPKIDGGYYPFDDRPPSDFRRVVTLRGPKKVERGDFYYSIEWLTQWGTTGICDPKIAVKPSLFREILFLFLAIFGISGLVLYRRWLKNRAA